MENEDSKLLNNNLNVTCEIFSQFRTYIPKHQISDTLITKIEYLTILIIFSDVDKAFLYFKLGSSALLSSIFQSKRSQRSFIIDEILNNFDSLPTHRTTSRQLVTHRDYSIQIFTYLILGLIESINITNKDHDIILPSRFPEAGSDQFKEVIEELNKLTEPFEEIKSEVDSTLNAISSSLINKIIKNPITAMRQRFHLFVTDLINIVKFPEFPAAESLLTTIMGALLSMSDTQQSIVESYFLEIIGIIGSTILEIRGLEESRCANGARLLVNEKSIVYQYLSSRVNTKGSKDTADFFISNWIFSIMNHLDDDKLQYVELYHGLIRGLQQGSFNSLFPRLEGASNSLQHQASLDYVHILRTSSFIGLYDSFLNRLLKYVDHPKIKSRTRALKNLALLVNRDLALLNVPQVRQSISSKIKDPSPLVRLAVLEIFDEYLLKKPEQLKELYQSVILTSDKSTAVRIKSLKISDRIYRDTKDKEIKLYIIEKIFKRLEDDEETVLDLAQNTIIQLLFLSIAPSDGNQLNLKESVDSSIEIILAYINKSEKNWELFENFLLTMVLRETALNQPIHKEILRITNIMIQNLFNFVIDNMDTELSVSQRLGLLSIIAKYDSPLISQEQLLSLQIYFTSDNCGTDISLYSLMILRQTISNVVSLRAEFLEDCEASLLKRLTKLNSRELSQAVPSLHHISVLKNESSKLANAAASCLSLINPYISKASKGELKNVDPRCTRLLFLIGNFAKECNFEKDRSFFETKKLLALKDKESVVSFMVKNLVVFTRPNVNDQIRKIAIKNLISVCSTHSSLFLSEHVLKIFDDEFQGSRVEFQEVIIQGLLEFLERQEKLSGKKSGYKEKKSGKVGLDVDVFHGNSKTFENDGICASLVQRYIDPVLRLCLLEDGGISYSAVKYLKFIVIKGFCNPRLCAPTVIALQASPVHYIRSVGLELFADLFERYESLIDTSYAQGFKEAIEFRSKLTKNILLETSSFLQKFYTIVEDSKSSKKKMMNQLVKSFQFDVNSISVEDCESFQNYVLFIAMNLAECEFNFYEEVFIIIDGIQPILFNEGMALAKLISQRGDLLKQPEDNPEAENDLKLGYICAILITFERLLTCLRHSYRIHETTEKTNELKAQRTKIQKQKMKLIKFTPGDSEVNTFVAHFNSIKL
jgi:cohesin loading factor subunit SCC2